MRIETTRDDHLIAWLAALAVVIHIAESAIPAPLPGFKPGLANVITLLALFLGGWRAALWVTLLRLLAGSLLSGTFLTPTFFLAGGGALGALALLALANRLPGTGPIGYSLLAACGHMAGQFLVAWSLFIPHPALLYLLPILMTLAVMTGLLNGIITQGALLHLQRRRRPATDE